MQCAIASLLGPYNALVCMWKRACDLHLALWALLATLLARDMIEENKDLGTKAKRLVVVKQERLGFIYIAS